jgi:hypothetical protein
VIKYKAEIIQAYKKLHAMHGSVMESIERLSKNELSIGTVKSQLIALGSRNYRREYINMNTGEVEYYEVLYLKAGRFVMHNMNGPAFVDNLKNEKRWYIYDQELPYWVPVIDNEKLIAFGNKERTERISADKSLILKTVFDFDREYGNYINAVFNKGKNE